jgi:hypothetical protein
MTDREELPRNATNEKRWRMAVREREVREWERVEWDRERNGDGVWVACVCGVRDRKIYTYTSRERVKVWEIERDAWVYVCMYVCMCTYVCVVGVKNSLVSFTLVAPLHWRRMVNPKAAKDRKKLSWKSVWEKKDIFATRNRLRKLIQSICVGRCCAHNFLPFLKIFGVGFFSTWISVTVPRFLQRKTMLRLIICKNWQ